MTEPWSTQQRNDLKPCPFCGTEAIEQGRMSDSDTATQWRIQCGNPFCEAVCQTRIFAALSDAERVWQDRVTIIHHGVIGGGHPTGDPANVAPLPGYDCGFQCAEAHPSPEKEADE